MSCPWSSDHLLIAVAALYDLLIPPPSLLSLSLPEPDANPCPSCSTFTGLAYVITAMVAALLAVVILVLVQNVLRRCCQMPQCKGRERRENTQETEETYMEVGPGAAGTRRDNFRLKTNDAYI